MRVFLLVYYLMRSYGNGRVRAAIKAFWCHQLHGKVYIFPNKWLVVERN